MTFRKVMVGLVLLACTSNALAVLDIVVTFDDNATRTWGDLEKAVVNKAIADWEDAFSKFGFGDGDGWNGTGYVELFLRNLGWEVEAETWGTHNYMIFSIKKGNRRYEFDGYDDPRTVMPKSLVKKLDEHFNDEWSVKG